MFAREGGGEFVEVGAGFAVWEVQKSRLLGLALLLQVGGIHVRGVGVLCWWVVGGGWYRSRRLFGCGFVFLVLLRIDVFLVGLPEWMSLYTTKEEQTVVGMD